MTTRGQAYFDKRTKRLNLPCPSWPTSSIMAVGHPAVGPWQGVFSGKVSDEEWHTFCNWLREWRDVLNNTGRVRDATDALPAGNDRGVLREVVQHKEQTTCQ